MLQQTLCTSALLTAVQVRECAHLRRAERFRRGQVSHRGAQLRAEGVDLPVVDLEDGISRGAPAATQVWSPTKATSTCRSKIY